MVKEAKVDTTQLDEVITLILYITTKHSFTVLCSGSLHVFGKKEYYYMTLNVMCK